MEKENLTNPSYFLPDMCRAKNVLYLTLIAQLLAIILALNTSFISGDFWNALSLNALFIVWVGFTCASIFCLFKHRINRYSPNHICALMFITINLTTFFITWVSSSLLPQMDLFMEPSQSHINIYIRNVGISIIFSLILLRFLYIQFQWRKQSKAEADAQLDALQARIRPHFLFNSLNTIASLTRLNPALAETLTEDLSELFRANIQTSKRLIPFQQELTLVQQYLNIEQMRLGERLLIETDLTAIPDNALIPPLSLQPIIENAVYHGIEPSEKGGTLKIIGRMDKDMITLLVSNPVNDSQSANARSGNKMAINNIRLRMAQCFPDQSKLLISASAGEFQTQLKFPYQTSFS